MTEAKKECSDCGHNQHQPRMCSATWPTSGQRCACTEGKATRHRWASESADAPRAGERLTVARTRAIRDVLYVGRRIWLRCPVAGITFEPIEGFWRRYQRKQLSLPMLFASVVFAAFALSSCFAYAGIAVAPNGTVWIATNSQGFGGQTAGDVYACNPRAGELQCVKIVTRGIP